MLIYLMLGLLWCCFLEYYTTSNLEGKLAQPWSWFERIFHTILWPYSLGVFLFHMFKN